MSAIASVLNPRWTYSHERLALSMMGKRVVATLFPPHPIPYLLVQTIDIVSENTVVIESRTY